MKNAATRGEMMVEACPLPSGGDWIDEGMQWKGFTEELRRQWHFLWRERIDDKVRAEEIAHKDFELLFIDKGTIIIATRKCKPPEFKEILDRYEAPYEIKVKQETPPPHVGGWRKFGREMAAKRRREFIRIHEDKSRKCSKKLQQKKGGRGWLHK